MASPDPGPRDLARDLDRVRAELRRLGYLSHRFDRFLLQDALTPRRPWRSLLALAVKVGLLAGAPLALALAFALAAANGNLAASPLDLFPLFAHLVAPAAAAVGLAFLVLCAALTVVLRVSHVRRIEGLALAAALLSGAAALALGVWRLPDLTAEARAWQLAVLAVAAPAAIYALVKLVYGGLLALAIRLTDHAPASRPFARRWPGVALALAAFLLFLPAVLAVGRPAPAPPPSLPAAPGDRVLLIGIDGVLPAEAEYLLARGELPALARLAAEGSGLLAYHRPPAEPPAVFWTTVATGRPAAEHGVTALDSYRPVGVATPLARSGPLRWYWARVAAPLGLAEHRPVLANRRRAFAVWELAARGGAPVVAVDWWGTFPAEELPGLVVAHGAYQLLAGDGGADAAADAVAPATLAAEVAAVRRDAAGAQDPGFVDAAVPGGGGELDERALAPDRFYRAVLARWAFRPAVHAAALYLPGLDIAAHGWSGGDVAFADLVRRELAAADRLLAEALAGGAEGLTVAVVLDPGRRGGGEGMVVLWRSSGCDGGGAEGVEEPAGGGAAPAPEAPATERAPRGVRHRPDETGEEAVPSVDPAAVASALVRALGLPQSAELPPPPAACSWPEAPGRVPTYGERSRRSEPGARGDEYLDSLRALGYL
jgi:hypothetical protein